MKKLFVFGCLAMLLVGCSGVGSNLETTIPTANPIAPTATLSTGVQEQQAEIRTAWEKSSHASGDIIVNCAACHQLQNGLATKDIAWLNQPKDQYEPVTNSNALCIKCHSVYENAKDVHAGMTCLDCHNQHSIKTACISCHQEVKKQTLAIPATPADGHPNGAEMDFCQSAGCHSIATQVAQKKTSSNHDAVHAAVTCEACHDAGGHLVGPEPNTGVWVPWTATDQNANIKSIPFRSHNLQARVECSRCHFEQNPWGLKSLGNPGNGY